MHKSSAGTKAVSYLKERGITQDVINCFNLGYAPGGWDNLLNFFLKKGISPVFLETSGLVLSRKNKNGYYDRFRDRIVFP
ncbi:DNA primase, partial [Desulfobacteraceae bacterium SEEP-SAG9]